MLELLKYLARIFAAVMLIGLAAMSAIAATFDDKATRWMLAVAAVFGLAGLFTWPRRPNAWRRDPPTERQLAYARDLGISLPRGVSKGELSDLISAAKAE